MEKPLVDFAQTPSPAPLWAEAGHDASAFGAALDRLFGEADLHLIEHYASVDQAILMLDDPLVLLSNLIDGLGVMGDPMPAPMPELVAVYDFAPEGFSHDHWVYDAHA